MGEKREIYPVRKAMNHTPPHTIRAEDAWYFITICAAERGGTSFTDHANAILDAARYYHQNGKWRLSLFLVMPDHIHAIVHIPLVRNDNGRAVCPKPPKSSPNEITLYNDCGGVGHTALPKYRSTLEHVIGEWKRYLSRTAGLAFQRDFFDTRLRDDEHYAEKWRYIVRNPVTRGLCAAPREWPHVIAFNRESCQQKQLFEKFE